MKTLEINPILDVTFNVNHILNGDIVDPYSEVLITLKDENEFLIMDDISDTTLFGVYLTDPSGAQTRIPFMDDNGATVMMWTPATAQNKRFGDARKERWNLFKELETEYGEDFAQKRMSSFNSAHLNVFEMRTCISLPHLSPSVIRDSNTDKNEKERASHAGPDFFKFRVSEPF